ncbi:hypothetical protein M0805_008522 [Coniferiporia weirii]|nr:hypothetical protein M0805_008522 [Coniferiporia weirii]
MEHPLTPPPSFRILRVRNRGRNRTISDENCRFQALESVKGDFSTFNAGSYVDDSSSQSRGRTRSRVVRGSLELENDARTKPQLSVALPSCCPPPGTAPLSPGQEEELIFQMSPILPQSPTGVFFDSVNEPRADASRVEETSMQALSALWENRKRITRPHATPKKAQYSHPFAPRTPHRRTRTGTVTQEQYHQRGVSDGAIDERRGLRNEHRPQQGVKTLLNLSGLLHTPPTPPPSEHREPFLYSFPSFESIPLMKARQARAQRAANKLLAHNGCSDGSLCIDLERCSGDDPMEGVIDTDPMCQRRPGPIRARKLRIESGESSCDDFEDANFISHAFRSESLDQEKDSGLDEEVAEEDEESYFSQRSSSVSSSATDATSLNHSSVLSSSLLASFPIRAASDSQYNMDSNPSSRSQSRRASPGPSNIGSGSKASVDAMMKRGRLLVAHSRRVSTEVRDAELYTGGDRRGPGRTPAPARRGVDSMHAAAAVWASIK